MNYWVYKKNMVNENTIMSFYRKCYEDAVSKNLPEWYLKYVYANGVGTLAELEKLGDMSYTTVTELLSQYLSWQHNENNLAILRDEGGNYYQTDKRFRALLERL